MALEGVFSNKAKENQEKGINQHSLKQISAEVKPIETRKELSKVASVSHDTIAKVKKTLSLKKLLNYEESTLLIICDYFIRMFF